MCVKSVYSSMNSSCKFHENIQNIFYSLKENISRSITHRQCKRLYNIYYYLTCPNITPVILYGYITPVVYKMVKRKSKIENRRSFLIPCYSFLSLSWANICPLSPRVSSKLVKCFTDCSGH